MKKKWHTYHYYRAINTVCCKGSVKIHIKIKNVPTICKI